MGTFGKLLAVGGCLTWALCTILGLVLAFGTGIIATMLGNDMASMLSLGGYGSFCCAMLGFMMFVVGAVLILVGGGGSEPVED